MKLARIAIVLAALIFGGKLAIEKITDATRIDSSLRRANLVVAGLAPGASGEAYQTAICMWWAGAMSLDQTEFNLAAAAFDQWAEDFRTEGPLAVSRSEIEAGGETIIVTLENERGPLRWRLARGKPIESLD